MIKKRHILLDSQTMSDEFIGYRVTIGIGDLDGNPTTPAVIEGFDEKTLHLRIGTKLKKVEYEPKRIVLCVYQFEKGIHFVSNAEMDEYEREQSQKQQS